MSTISTQGRSRKKSSQRVQADPMGTSKRSQRVTALFGKKPNSMPWRSYHAIIQTKPWDMDLMRCARYEGPPEGQPMQRFMSPSKKLTPQDRQQIKQAHDDLAAGRITQGDYARMLHSVDRAITLPLWAPDATCTTMGEQNPCGKGDDCECFDQDD